MQIVTEANDISLEVSSIISLKDPVETQSKKDSILNKVVIIVSILSLILVFMYCFYVNNYAQKYSALKDLLIPQPFVEDNDFFSFELENQLRVLIIKPNQGYKNTQISITVGVGSESDPPEFIGFTHLIEHLLFTGSKNYSKDNYIETVCNKY